MHMLHLHMTLHGKIRLIMHTLCHYRIVVVCIVTKSHCWQKFNRYFHLLLIYTIRCQRTGHPLQPPLTALDIVNYSGPCPTVGCYGYGHVKGAKFSGHHR